MKITWVEWLSEFLTLAPDGGEQSISHSGHFTAQGKAPGIQWITKWMDWSGYHREEKNLLPLSIIEL
jgi:hypothetical protein